MVELEAPFESPEPRVIVVDDDPFARRAIADALRRAGIVVVAEAADGMTAVDLVRQHRPDVVLMDVAMPGMDGITATRRIVKDRPDQLVVLLAGTADDDLAVLGLHVGAVGFITKDVGLDALARAVIGAVRGEAAVSRTLARRLLERIRHVPVVGAGFRPIHSPLTRREWEVLDLICDGRTTEEMAQFFVVSDETIRSHVKRILRKLDVNSREEAIAAVRRIRGAAA